MKTSLTLAACCIGICGCAASPPRDTFDDRPRQRVNASSAIDEYMATARHRQPAPTLQSAADKRVAALEDQIQQLQLSLAILAEARHTPPANPSGPDAARTAGNTLSPTDLGTGEAIELRSRSILFRVPSPVAQARFTPSPTLRHWLLQAASRGGSIAVHGRTDATTPDKANGAIALQRAMAARQFLLSQGVAASRIRSDFLAAGDFAVDNGTPAGRARNRRVDIEVRDIAPEAYRELAATIPGDQHE